MPKFIVTVKEPLIGGYRYATIKVKAEGLQEAIVDAIKNFNKDEHTWQLYPGTLSKVEPTGRAISFTAKKLLPNNLQSPPQL